MTQQAHDPQFPQSSSGMLYPKNYVVGIIDDVQDARQAFKAAGYTTDEVRLMESQEAQQKIQELEHEKNWLQHILSSFQDTTDETSARVYQAAARAGKQILHVRANSQQEVDKISALMQSYHAHAAKCSAAGWRLSVAAINVMPG